MVPDLLSPIARRFAVVMLLVAGTMLPGTALAQDSTPSTGIFKTAQQVNDACVSSDDTDLERCDWFIMASHDMMKFYGDTDAGGDKICLPKGVKELEVRNSILAYWKANPGSLRYSAVSTIYNALVEKYPC